MHKYYGKDLAERYGYLVFLMISEELEWHVFPHEEWSFLKYSIIPKSKFEAQKKFFTTLGIELFVRSALFRLANDEMSVARRLLTRFIITMPMEVFDTDIVGMEPILTAFQAQRLDDLWILERRVVESNFEILKQYAREE